jgi:hypothetical protein
MSAVWRRSIIGYYDGMVMTLADSDRVVRVEFRCATGLGAASGRSANRLRAPSRSRRGQLAARSAPWTGSRAAFGRAGVNAPGRRRTAARPGPDSSEPSAAQCDRRRRHPSRLRRRMAPLEDPRRAGGHHPPDARDLKPRAELVRTVCPFHRQGHARTPSTTATAPSLASRRHAKRDDRNPSRSSHDDG